MTDRYSGEMGGHWTRVEVGESYYVRLPTFLGPCLLTVVGSWLRTHELAVGDNGRIELDPDRLSVVGGPSAGYPCSPRADSARCARRPRSTPLRMLQFRVSVTLKTKTQQHRSYISYHAMG